MLGGICSGMAEYFGVGDVVFWRLGVLILAIICGINISLSFIPDFICYDKLDTWRNFTGLRNELNYLITPTGARLLGTIKKPMTIEEVYEAKNNG